MSVHGGPVDSSPQLIRIVCRLEAHGDVLVDELDGHGDQWDSTAGRAALGSSTAAPELGLGDSSVQHLDAEDRPAVGDGGPEALLGGLLGWPAADAVRDRYRFVCPRCRDTVEARALHLRPVLRTLLDHGVPEVSLELLRDLMRQAQGRRRGSA